MSGIVPSHWAGYDTRPLQADQIRAEVFRTLVGQNTARDEMNIRQSMENRRLAATSALQRELADREERSKEILMAREAALRNSLADKEANMRIQLQKDLLAGSSQAELQKLDKAAQLERSSPQGQMYLQKAMAYRQLPTEQRLHALTGIDPMQRKIQEEDIINKRRALDIEQKKLDMMEKARDEDRAQKYQSSWMKQQMKPDDYYRQKIKIGQDYTKSALQKLDAFGSLALMSNMPRAVYDYVLTANDFLRSTGFKKTPENVALLDKGAQLINNLKDGIASEEALLPLLMPHERQYKELQISQMRQSLQRAEGEFKNAFVKLYGYKFGETPPQPQNSRYIPGGLGREIDAMKSLFNIGGR